MFLPPKTNYIVFQNKKIDETKFLLVYNEFYVKTLIFKKFYKKKYNLYFQLSTKYLHNSNLFNKFLLKWYIYPTNKIKFSGKGYKIVKHGFCLNLSLNTSHEQWSFFFQTLPIKIQKQRFLFFNKNSSELGKILNALINLRLINIYTKRGLRLGRQQIVKKVGKRSS